MADSKTLKLLLVEDDLEDEQLLSEALIEIEEQREWCDWRTSSIVHVEQLEDALDCLRQEQFDVVLLNLSLPDSPALLDSFLAANTAANGAPIVVLADEKDEHLAHRLLRAGAQDVLLKSELDYGPLARSLRYAIERQRRTKALLASPFIDDLTGVLNLQGFLTIGSHYEKLSARYYTPSSSFPPSDNSEVGQTSSAARDVHIPLPAQTGKTGIGCGSAALWGGRPRPRRAAWPGLAPDTMLAAGVELTGLSESTSEDREAAELLLIRAAEVLRGTFQAPALIGRVNPFSFGLILPGLTSTTAEAPLNQASREIEDAARALGRNSNVVYSTMPLDCIEEQFSHTEQVRSKTVMLAD